MTWRDWREVRIPWLPLVRCRARWATSRCERTRWHRWMHAEGSYVWGDEVNYDYGTFPTSKALREL